MRSHELFDISDYAAQQNPGWRVRWGAEGSNAVLLVNNDPSKKYLDWRLYKGVPPEGIELNENRQFTIKEEYREKLECCDLHLPSKKEAMEAPMIFKTSYASHTGGLAAPRRRQQNIPYIRSDVMQTLEQAFFEKLIAPYMDTHVVYALSESGTRLASRLGVKNVNDIFVTHYTSDTFQDESIIHVSGFPVFDRDQPVLVIDDMVSSGHTAAAVLAAFAKAGVTKVRYVALFDIIASRENHDVDAAIETFMPVSNFYWMYGRGMDLMDEESRRYLHIYGADKSYEGETENDVQDLFNFFNF